jgi:TatD DNase family protein
VHLALGLHPLPARFHQRELPEFLRLIPSVRFVGEIGLDFSPAGSRTRELQVRSFRRIAESLSVSRVLLLFTPEERKSRFLKTLQCHGVRPVVFHRFTGSRNALLRLLEAGHLVSVNTAMARSKKWRELFPLIPKERVLTESDGHMQSAALVRQSQPIFKYVPRWLATQWDIPQHEAESVVNDDFRQVFPGPIS